MSEAGQGELFASGVTAPATAPQVPAVVHALGDRPSGAARVLHTSDWHLGAAVRNESRAPDHDARITELVDEGEKEGATRRSITCALPETGYWFPPTLFLDVAPANRIAVEEIFGPVVSVTTFRTPQEAVERANNSAYGLAAGVWTDNGSKAFQVAGQLRAGVVWQNTYNKFDPTAAFGGYKESGFGRVNGAEAIEGYLQTKSVWVELSEDVQDPFVMKV